MGKAQGLLEYLLLVGAALMVALIVVVVIANYILPIVQQGGVGTDIAACGLEGIELIGYQNPFDGTEDTLPDGIAYHGRTLVLGGVAGSIDVASCTLNKVSLTLYQEGEPPVFSATIGNFSFTEA